MLPKEQRLKRDQDFDRIFKQGKKAFSHPFTVRFEKTNRSHSRVAIIVGTKVSKKAVVRNRIRRQIREVVRLVIDQFVATADVVLSALPEVIDMDHETLEQVTKKALKKVGLLV